MNTSPYFFTDNTSVSFSGGRTSAYMLHEIIQAHGGALPDHIKVCFANTGKEMPETLDFVNECSVRWNVPIVWLEYNPDLPEKFEIVSHNSASRNGEPFEKIILKKKMLPNPVIRFCTAELKIRTMKRYLMSLGWMEWTAALGLRADEMHRVARLANNRDRGEPVAPLAKAGITKKHIQRFWQAAPFDLKLPNINGTTPMGNCDLCFLKPTSTINGLIRDYPHLAEWWIKQETENAATTMLKPEMAMFRKDRPKYEALLKATKDQTPFDFGESDKLQECFCHD